MSLRLVLLPCDALSAALDKSLDDTQQHQLTSGGVRRVELLGSSVGTCQSI